MFVRCSSSSGLGPYCAEAREAPRRRRVERCMVKLVFLFLLVAVFRFFSLCFYVYRWRLVVDFCRWLALVVEMVVGGEGTINARDQASY